MLCPLFNLLHLIFPCTVVILTWQRQQRANSQKIICVSSCHKNLYILPLISISFVLNWSLYSSLALAVFWLFPRPPEYSVRLPLLNGAGFTSALLKWNTFTWDGSQTESNHNLKKKRHILIGEGECVRDGEGNKYQLKWNMCSFLFHPGLDLSSAHERIMNFCNGSTYVYYSL